MPTIDPTSVAERIDTEVRLSRELIVPFDVNGRMVYFRLICPKCASTFWLMADDNKSIACDNTDCDCVPLVIPVGIGEGYPLWKI